MLDHPQRGRRLHWVDDVDDGRLAQLYATSGLLVMASHGEGYGLPIGEAASAGCRLLLRDLPVFREVAGARARYFDTPEALLLALRGLSHGSPAEWPDLAQPAWPTWAQSAQAMVGELADRGGEP
jgi:hypothetical protein